MGLIVTFYSYKGGVGRTMALANIAVLLSQMGRRVLIVDWDLEAPGLDRYFKDYLSPSEINKPGLLDLFVSAITPNLKSGAIDWKDLLVNIDIGGEHPLSLISSGNKDDGKYVSRVIQFDWRTFFSECNGGEYIENLRNEWRDEFDIVLLDSRTGITDSGGVCTIQMP